MPNENPEAQAEGFSYATRAASCPIKFPHKKLYTLRRKCYD